MKQYDFRVVEVTNSILSVSYLCDQGIETHLAREPFLKYGDRRELFVRTGDSRNLQKSCVRAEEISKTCVRAKSSQKHTHELKIQGIRKIRAVSSKRDDEVVQPVDEDPIDDDRILVDAGAEPITTPWEPCEMEKMTSHSNNGAHQSCVKLPIVKCDKLCSQRLCSLRWIESFEHVREIVSARHIHN